MNIHDLLNYGCFHKKEHIWIKRLKPTQGPPRSNFTTSLYSVQCTVYRPNVLPVPILIVWPYTNPLVSFYWVKCWKVEAWWKEEGSGWYLYGAKALCPKLKMECSNETRYRKPSLRMGSGSFVDTNIFVKKYYFMRFLLILFWFSDFLN